MLLKTLWSALALLTLAGCKCEGEDCPWGYGLGGSDSFLKLPFLSGEYWILTQSYDQGSHVNYGFDFGDDTYALDFTQNGCDAYGEPVTPMADGVVMEILTEGNGDHGYGNTVLVDHGDGYVSRYGHLAELWVSEGTELDDSDPLGTVGNSGYAIGTACTSHPGTHLHVAFYKDGEALKPEPLSGNSELQEYCWYNREGDVNCDGNPGDYEPREEHDDYDGNQGESYDVDIDDEGELGISYLGISPSHGTAAETEFVWVAIVVSPDERPDATLIIENPNDGVEYEFEMETESKESPYVFTYQKTLRDEDTEYDYWVKTSNGDGNDTSDKQSIEVDDADGNVPSLGYYTISPDNGEANETEFEWTTIVRSEDRPEVWLHIASALDGQVYSFEMDVDRRDDDDDRWDASYEKTLRDPAIYSYWMTAENDDTVNAGIVLSLEVE